MVHARVSEKYIHFALIYTTCHIFPVSPINHLINHYGEPTTPQKLTTSNKPSVSNLHVLFCPFVVQKATAHVDGKSLNMRHLPPKVFGVSSLEFHNTKNGASSTYQVH